MRCGQSFPGLEDDWLEVTGAPFEALTEAEARALLRFGDEGALKERVLQIATARGVTAAGPLGTGVAEAPRGTGAPSASGSDSASWRPPAADDVRNAAPDSDYFLTSPTGRRFLRGPEQTPRLGDVPAFPGAPHAEGNLDVRLLRGTIKHIDTPAKRVEARLLGYQDGLHLTTDVAANWTQARRGYDGRLILVKPNGTAKVAIVELERDEEGYYRVVTSGLRDPDRFAREAELLWQRVREPSASAAGQPSPLLASPLDAGAAQQSTSGQSSEGILHPGQVFLNWARIDTADDVKAAIQQMADAGAGDIDAARRGVRSHGATRAAAAEEDAWQVLMRRRADGGGQPLNAERTLAVRELWTASAQKLIEVARLAAANPSEVNLFAFRKMLAAHNLIQREAIAARTETARALESWKIPAGGPAERHPVLAARLPAAVAAAAVGG